MSINIGNVTVLGTGVLGSQIAFQCAYRGFDVTAYDVSDDVLANAHSRFGAIAETYKREVTGADDDTVTAAQGRLRLSSDLADAVGEADLVIEAVPEVLDIKRDTYTKLGRVAPDKSIFATNSSTLLPSDLKDFTGRPTKFLALHFANDMWKFNIAEVMGTVETDPAVFDRSARLRRTKRAQPLVSTLVREDTPAVPSRPTGDRLVPLGLQIARLSERLDLVLGRRIGDIVGSTVDETGGEEFLGRG